MEEPVLDQLSSRLDHFSEAKEVKDIVNSLLRVTTPEEADKLVQQASTLLNKYQEQPVLLDPHLEGLVQPLLLHIRAATVPNAVLDELYKLIYVITKVRGHKAVVKHFTHETADLLPVLAALTAQDPARHEAWPTRYVQLLWLSILAMIPFNFAIYDVADQTPVADQLFSLCKQYLVATDKCQDAAALLLARLATRPDMQGGLLPSVRTWILEKLRVTEGNRSAETAIAGALAVTALVLKIGKREVLLPLVDELLSAATAPHLLESPNTHVRKLAIKVTQRLGMTMLKPRIAAWRYQRGQRSLLNNLGGAAATSTPAAASTQQQDEEEEEYDVPDGVETVLQVLLAAIRDKDTIVRWSAAKGVGRITGRLPGHLGDEVLGSLLELFSPAELDGAWHGGCLALAELARRGLLLPARLAEVVPVVTRSLTYDLLKGSYSVGAHVRDAACYVSWAFARAYAPAVLTPFMAGLADALLATALFDRETNVRRAASAALQEHVGRQGTLPHGIELITAADYFSVGNRTAAYLEIAPSLAGRPEYGPGLVRHLAAHKIAHWDRDVRLLAAQALGRLCATNCDLVISTTREQLLPDMLAADLNRRHGALLAVGQIALGLASAGTPTRLAELVGPDATAIVNVAENLTKAGAFRGLGGDVTRTAVFQCFRDLSHACFPVPPAALATWQALLLDGLVYSDDAIQALAAEAQTALAATYYTDVSQHACAHSILDNALKHLAPDSTQAVHFRKGHIMTIGSFPSLLVAPMSERIAATLHAEIADANALLVDCRRVAAVALTTIAQRMAAEKSTEPAITTKFLLSAFDSLLLAINDYTIDGHGDVGSFVREVAMQGLVDLIRQHTVTPFLPEDKIAAATCGFAQQCLEKIDRTRAVAGTALLDVTYLSSLQSVPARDDLIAIFGAERPALDWSAAANVFPLTVRLLVLSPYRIPALTGLVVSVGGLTESLVRSSRGALLALLSSLDDAARAAIVEAFVPLFTSNSERIAIPLLNTLALLFEHAAIDQVLRDREPLALELVKLTKAAIATSAEVKKILAGIEVLCGFLSISAECRVRSLNHLVLCLCHRFPRVRKMTSEKVYVALLAIDPFCEPDKLDEATALLTDTLWDGPLEAARVARNAFCQALGLALPVTKGKAPAAGAAAATSAGAGAAGGDDGRGSGSDEGWGNSCCWGC
eukprot:m.102538 g.102538  ORF g.102538 m.102538 type:complete len:1182 (+) comp14122_c1_seq1:62-3607(+)